MKKLVVSLEKVPVVLSGHPWIFSGAICHIDPIEPGEMVHIVDPSGKFLAMGYAHPGQSLTARILSYQKEDINELIKKRLQEAYRLRKETGLLDITNAYRLINAEGDRLGGLIVDIYKDVAVIQVATYGMERLKSLIIESLIAMLGLACVIERSMSSSRALEGLEPLNIVHYGQMPDRIAIFEGDVILEVDLKEGQKTGFFLDQRPMRMALCPFAKNKSVLNMFSYTGGFSLHALKAGAKSCVSVDVDHKALKLLDGLINLNHITQSHKSVCQDAFDYLNKTDLKGFDLIILDPPAFAKKRQDIPNAANGYKKLMMAALSKMKEESFLYVASCSYFMDKAHFEKLLFQAAFETGTRLKFVLDQISSVDHPRLFSHKEGSYLKGFLVQVFRS